MQYDMQKLGRMTLEQLTEIAETFGIKVRRSASLQSIIYDILDAQADKRGAEVQAREEARQAKGEEKKRNKRARIQTAPTKVNTDNLKSNRVLATVGNEQDTLEQIKEEQAKQPVIKPVISAQTTIFDTPAAEVPTQTQEQAPAPTENTNSKKKKGNKQQAPVVAAETPATEEVAADAPAAKPKKKKGRPKKAENAEVNAAQPVAEEPAPVAENTAPDKAPTNNNNAPKPYAQAARQH